MVTPFTDSFHHESVRSGFVGLPLTSWEIAWRHERRFRHVWECPGTSLSAHGATLISSRAHCDTRRVLNEARDIAATPPRDRTQSVRVRSGCIITAMALRDLPSSSDLSLHLASVWLCHHLPWTGERWSRARFSDFGRPPTSGDDVGRPGAVRGGPRIHGVARGHRRDGQCARRPGRGGPWRRVATPACWGAISFWSWSSWSPGSRCSRRCFGQQNLVRWHRRLGSWPHRPHLRPRRAHHDRLRRARPLAVCGASCVDWSVPTPTSWRPSWGSGCSWWPAVSSWRVARRRLRYETWWVIHLYLYLALALAFAHQLANGASFVHHPLDRVWWAALWAGTAGVVIGYRIVVPVCRSLYYRLRVLSVQPETSDVVSITLSGRHRGASAGVGRTVLPVALPGQGGVVGGASVFVVRHAVAPHRARHRQGLGRSQRAAGDHRPGHADLHRGTAWGVHQVRPHRPSGGTRGRRHRGDAAAGAARGPPFRRRRRRDPAVFDARKAGAARRDRRARGRAQRRAA